MPIPKSEEDFLAQALAFAYGDEAEPSDAPPPPRTPGKATEESTWHPDLNPSQKLIFDDPAPNVLGYGEKGSGKSIGFGHKIVRHAWENDNALVLIIAPSIRTGNEGIWYDLDTLILPQWRKGMGLEYTPSKLDPLTKDRHRWIKNRFGGWSKLLLISIPFPSQVQDRIKGPAPSMVYVDELTNCAGREYWQYTAAQLGRRRGIHGPQQFCASCNPDGPSHWVYQVFWIEATNPDGTRNPRFSVHHVPITENKHRLPEGYIERLHDTFKSDPVEMRRLIYGEWIDRPTGEGLFKDYYVEAIHIKGDAVKGLGLRPTPGFPIIIGYDLGQVYSSITFLQLVTVKEKDKEGKVTYKPIWKVFDEVDHLGERTLYKKMAWEVIERMRHWRTLCDYPFQYMHVTDESAINQWRPGGEGSYDAWEFEKEFNRVAVELGVTDVSKLRMLGCPKGQGSVAARIRLLQGKLYQEEVFVSATCKNAREMLLHLESEKDDPNKPRRSRFLHKFDSITYPMLKMEINGSTRQATPLAPEAPTLVRMGAGVDRG